MIYEQYKNTTIEVLSLNIVKLFDDLVIGAVNSFENSIYNINSADSIGLDIWGKLLNFPRHINIPGNLSYITLEDNQYRLILSILAFQAASDPTIENINKNMSTLFSGIIGVKAYVVDNGDMEFITYVFTDKIPDWLKIIFENYDILPRPMGVGVNLTELTVGILGFEGQTTEAEPFTNLYAAIFPPSKDETVYISFTGQDKYGDSVGAFGDTIFNKKDEI